MLLLSWKVHIPIGSTVRYSEAMENATKDKPYTPLFVPLVQIVVCSAESLSVICTKGISLLLISIADIITAEGFLGAFISEQ